MKATVEESRQWPIEDVCRFLNNNDLFLYLSLPVAWFLNALFLLVCS